MSPAGALQFIDLGRQYAAYRDEIDARMRGVLAHTQFIQGPEVAELEAGLAVRLGVAHAIATGSGTASLELALRALGVGPGDEVVVPPFTFVASAEVVRLVGARIVFADIEARSFTLDPDRAAAAITARTKAIVAVDLFGQMADYARLNALAAAHGIPVIEDAAQSLGATQQGRPAGTMTLVGCTSFFPTKTLGCFGEAGAVFTDDAALAGRVRALRNHGTDEGVDHARVGLNGRCDTLQAAVLLAKLPHLDAELATRRSLAAGYREALDDVCVVPEVMHGNTHVFTPFTIRVRRRDEVRRRLHDAGVPTAIYYPRALHEHPAYADAGVCGDFPVAERAAREVLSLPLHPFLTRAEQDAVIRGVRDVVHGLVAAPGP